MRTMQPQFTLSDWNRLPEGFRAQLFDGCLVREPSPTYEHQTLEGRTYRHLVSLPGETRVVFAPSDVVLDRFNLVQPNICVLHAPPALDSHDVGIPLVVFEVLSPSTRKRDRTVKATGFLAAGVEEVWLVDPARETIEVRSTRESIVHRGPDVARSEVLEDFTLVPQALFTRPEAGDTPSAP